MADTRLPGIRRRIALVEDEATVRRALARVLGAAHFAVESFSSGEEFLQSVDAKLPDCIVLDMQMTGLTGRDVQRHLAARRIHTPVIIITAHDEPASRSQFLAEGAAAYLCKPLASASLVAAIEAAISAAG
ncbi:MAG TPA: response regulator [Steroidobacteraceae bacterium]